MSYQPSAISYQRSAEAQKLTLTAERIGFVTGQPTWSGPTRLAAVTDDAPGWRALNAAPHDRSLADQQAAYQEALTAWRKNPLAWRIIQITTDYTVGEGIGLSSRDPDMQRFIDAFWHHPQNHLPLRLAGMSEELARAGDLFPVLFRQPHDGVSLLRFITKDQVQEIETAAGDWERETAVIAEDVMTRPNPRRWPTPARRGGAAGAAVVLHYQSTGRSGAAFGESDLATMLPWLLRYSRLLEDRVRLHWAARMFLWLVQVPRNRVAGEGGAVPHAAGRGFGDRARRERELVGRGPGAARRGRGPGSEGGAQYDRRRARATRRTGAARRRM